VHFFGAKFQGIFTMSMRAGAAGSKPAQSRTSALPMMRERDFIGHWRRSMRRHMLDLGAPIRIEYGRKKHQEKPQNVTANSERDTLPVVACIPPVP
jgi:hypothetical protein